MRFYVYIYNYLHNCNIITLIQLTFNLDGIVPRGIHGLQILKLSCSSLPAAISLNSENESGVFHCVYNIVYTPCVFVHRNYHDLLVEIPRVR